MKDKEKQIEICENCKIKENCSHRILTHMEKCKVNNCDYFQNISNDIKKHIEETIKEIAECNKESCKDCKIICTYFYAIKRFCEIFLPEDSVVLSGEEYIDLSRNYVGEQVAQARKETAEKILKWLVGNKHLVNRTHEIGFEKPRTSYLVLNDEIENLAKQFNVEIKE